MEMLGHRKFLPRIRENIPPSQWSNTGAEAQSGGDVSNLTDIPNLTGYDLKQTLTLGVSLRLVRL